MAVFQQRPRNGPLYAEGVKNHDFWPISRFISKMIQDTAIVASECEQETVSSPIHLFQQAFYKMLYSFWHAQLLYYYYYSYFIEFTHQTCMKKVHDNVHKRYSDKTMLTIKTNLLKIEQAPVNKGTFIGTGGTGATPMQCISLLQLYSSFRVVPFSMILNNP